MKFFYQTSPAKFFTNIKGDIDFSSFGYSGTNKYINDGVTWWEIDVDGNIVSSGII
ncbi:hypothetical protein D3C84_1152750 [compost metagenome]